MNFIHIFFSLFIPFIEVIKIKIINLKINSAKILITFSILIAIIFILFATIRVININNPQKTIVMTNENYTSILYDCNNNIENYLGLEVTLTGYIFRMDDFSDTQFVIARDMLINSTQAQIVGFLCTYENAKEFDDNLWVKATGVITKGNFNGQIPIVSIKTLKKITTPNDIFVYPPNQKENFNF